jgi:hypothetical protein
MAKSNLERVFLLIAHGMEMLDALPDRQES